MGGDTLVAPSTPAVMLSTKETIEKADETTAMEVVAVTAPSAALDGVDGASINGTGGGVLPMSSPDAVSAEDTSAEEVEEDLSEESRAALVKQVEFYFSDENLPTDTFMKKKIKAGGVQGWVSLKVIANFPKLKKISKDLRAISLALDASDALVVKDGRVRRKTPFVFPDKEGMSDVVSRTVLAVNIPADSTAETLLPFFSVCGVAEAIRVVRNSTKNASNTNNNNKPPKDIQPPVGAHRDLYATCQYSTLEEAIRAVNELTDRNSWRGGRRVMLANGVSVEKALAKLKASAGKKARQEQRSKDGRSPTPGESASPRPDGQRKKMAGGGWLRRCSNAMIPEGQGVGCTNSEVRTNPRSPTDAAARNVREGQMRSRSLTELELEAKGSGGGGVRATPPRRAREDGGSSGDGSDVGPSTRKPRSVSNADALFSGGGGSGECSPPRHNMANGEGLPRKGVVQTVSAEGWSWIKKDGHGSRKGGNRIPFSMADVVAKDGEELRPLQKGDQVEYLAWKDNKGKVVAVRVERARERPRASGAGAGGAGTQWRTDRATQAHFRMAIGPEEGKNGFAAGRGKPIETPPPPQGVLAGGAGDAVRRPRGSSMGGPDSKVFVPASLAAAAQFQDAD